MKATPINQYDLTDTAGADMGSTQGARGATGVEPMSGDRKKLNRALRVPPDPEASFSIRLVVFFGRRRR